MKKSLFYKVDNPTPALKPKNEGVTPTSDTNTADNNAPVVSERNGSVTQALIDAGAKPVSAEEKQGPNNQVENGGRG